MAKLVYFVYCAGIDNKDGNEFNGVKLEDESSRPSKIAYLINPLLMVKVPFIPTTYSLGFSLGIKDIDSTANNEFGIEMINPNGTVIFQTSWPTMTNLQEITDKKGIIQLAGMVNNLILKIEGTYITKVKFNGKDIGEAELEVRKNV